MKKVLSILSIVFIAFGGCKTQGPPDIRLKFEENISLTYEEVIEAYSQLDSHYPEAKLIEIGATDIGKPLHMFMISSDREFDPESIRNAGKCIVMVNNGIHPGEPEGIDASIIFARDILDRNNGMHRYLENVVLAIIPVYNIGGALDRSEYYRTNQNGPVEKGRRRNAKNMDLNRDFAKQDTKNATSFARTFTHLNPDVFLDTHVTNGSDHQYTITLIPTLYSKLDPSMGDFFRNKMVPSLYERMKMNSEYDMIPYVQTFNRGDIRSGIIGYNDNPYYSTGYAALFNCYSFMTENLVYKYFPDRVKSVVDFLTQLVAFTSDNAAEISRLKEVADEKVKTQEEFILSWKLNPEKYEKILFRGYEYVMTESPVTHRRTGFYDHERPWVDSIPYYNDYDPVLRVKKPYAYIIPQAWDEIAEKLKNNSVELYRLAADTTLDVETYYIDKAIASERTTQGHHVNSGVEVHTVVQPMKYYRGDWVVIVNQRTNKYIVEMLEPHAPDSFFAWNYFDSVLESHDYYSVWGFESHFLELLDEDIDLRNRFEKKKAEDAEFANNPVLQLQYLYQVAPEHEIEKWNRLYPVARLTGETELLLTGQK